jgi:hypothetical protein
VESKRPVIKDRRINRTDKYRAHFQQEKERNARWAELIKNLEGYKLSSDETIAIKNEILKKECELLRQE